MRADRLLSILLLLQTRGRLTASRLANLLEVSERTIYRDLDALCTAGIPVYTERGPGGGCELTEGYRTNLTGLTEGEVRTLFIGGVRGPLADLGLGSVLEEALLKLLVALPSVHRHDAQRVRERFLLDGAGWFQSLEPVPFLHVFQEAVWQDRRLRLVYRRADGTHSERIIDPYGLVAKTSIWYVVAGIEQGREMRVYRVSRVLSADLLDDEIERPPDFDLVDYWTAWCASFEKSLQRYPIRLRVAPEMLTVLPRVFGDGIYTVIEQAGPPDSEGWITLPLTFESGDVACGRVLSLGARVEVIEPRELRVRVAQAARAIASVYGGG